LVIEEGALCVLSKPIYVEKILDTIKAAVPPRSDPEEDVTLVLKRTGERSI
jgi:hypothetical protein